MRIGILGQGVSGIFLALFLKNNNKDLDVTIIDKNSIPARKLLNTGNGRCNLANSDINEKSYNSPFVKNVVDAFNSEKIIETLNKRGIFTRNFNTCIYPYSLSARSFADYLIILAKEAKIKFVNDENFLDYHLENNKIIVETSKKKFTFDKFVFASGSNSAAFLGGSSSVINCLEKHGYKINALKPGLAPIRTIELTKNAENQKVKAKVTLIIDKKVIYEETGEVLFKKDGLSGIAIFNCASMIARSSKFKKATISLDLVPEYSFDEIYKILLEHNSTSKCSVLNGFFTKTMSEYIRKEAGIKNLSSFTTSEIKKIAQKLKNFEFTYKETYSFENSQVTVGGVDLNQINENFESKKEKNIYLIGEILDADGLCGGYNIMWAIASANQLAKNF